jgi:hypothetical protein
MDASGSETLTGPELQGLLHEKSHENVMHEPFLRETKRLRGLNNCYKNLNKIYHIDEKDTIKIHDEKNNLTKNWDQC